MLSGDLRGVIWLKSVAPENRLCLGILDGVNSVPLDGFVVKKSLRVVDIGWFG